MSTKLNNHCPVCQKLIWSSSLYCRKHYPTTTKFQKGHPKSFDGKKLIGIKQPLEVKIKKSIAMLGITASKWNGFVTSEYKRIRKSPEYKTWRKAVFERDNYTCQSCKKRGDYIEADHIKPFAKYPELRLDLNNGRTLCKPCHNQVTFREVYQ